MRVGHCIAAAGEGCHEGELCQVAPGQHSHVTGGVQICLLVGRPQAGRSPDLSVPVSILMLCALQLVDKPVYNNAQQHVVLTSMLFNHMCKVTGVCERELMLPQLSRCSAKILARV